MKKLTVVLLLIALLGAGVLTWRNFRDCSSLAKVEASVEKMGGKNAEASKTIYRKLLKSRGLDVTSSQFTIAGIVTLLALLATLALLALVFMKKVNLLLPGSIGLIIITIAMILANPSYNTGAAGPAPARTLALIIGVIAILGSVTNILYAKKEQA